MQGDRLIERLRNGICDDKCRVMEARSGCDCATAADALTAANEKIGRLEKALRSARTQADDMIFNLRQDRYPCERVVVVRALEIVRDAIDRAALDDTGGA